MKPQPSELPSQSSDVKVFAAVGNVRVEARSLFSPGEGDEALYRFIGSIFRSPDVHTLRIDRDRSAVEIRYDDRHLDMATALEQFSRQLIRPEPTEDMALVDLLKQASGPVKWVQRKSAAPRGSARWLGRFGLARRIDSFLPLSTRWWTFRAEETRGNRLSRFASENWIISCAEAGPLGIAPGTEPDEDAMSLSLAYVDEPPVRYARKTEGVRLDLRTRAARAGRRLFNLLAAGGCFVMSIVGIVTPGIPTVPFVLATSYFLARSSPALHERFRQSKLFGQMIRDWEERWAIRKSAKAKLVFVTLGLMVLTVGMAGFSIPMIIVIGTLMPLGLIVIWRIPTLREDAAREPRLGIATV